jgi:hypothetical protein
MGIPIVCWKVIAQDYRDIVNEKLQHLFNDNFRKLAHGVGGVDKKYLCDN